MCGRCGNLRSECSDPTIDWHPQVEHCWADASKVWGVRRLREKHRDAEPTPAELHPLDGAVVWVSKDNLSPSSDDFA